MAPTQNLITLAKRSAIAAAAPHIVRSAVGHINNRRGLTVNDTQKVTLGVIAAYVVGIAILWNVPYIKWVLWPFKVLPPCPPFVSRDIANEEENRCW